MPRVTQFVVLALALMVASLTVLAECNVRPESLRGAWKHVNNAGFFEQMEFTSERERNIFNSWLHAPSSRERPRHLLNKIADDKGQAFFDCKFCVEICE